MDTAIVVQPRRWFVAASFNRNHFFTAHLQEILMGRSILLWLIGIPIPIIILLALFWR